jgi:two-component system, NarL family, response regulator NreC
MRAGLRAILEDEPAIEVIGEAPDGETALHLVNEHDPDIVLLDIGMPGIDGIETTRQLKKRSSSSKVLILSVYEDEALLKEAIKAGASGYVIKRAAEEELIEAIRIVSRGDMYIHPSILKLILKDINPAIEPKQDVLSVLTPREFEILSHIVRGYTNRQIAEVLFISMRTVEGHRASVFGKLGLKNRVELVEFAEKYGLLAK